MKPYIVFLLCLAGALAFLFSSEASLAATNTDSSNRASTTAQCKSRFATLDIAIDYKEHEATVTRLCRNGRVRTEVYATTSTSSIVRQISRDFKIKQRQVRQRADYMYVNTDAIYRVDVKINTEKEIVLSFYRANGRLAERITTNEDIIDRIVELRFNGDYTAYSNLVLIAMNQIMFGQHPTEFHTVIADIIMSERLIQGMTREKLDWIIRYEAPLGLKFKSRTPLSR